MPAGRARWMGGKLATSTASASRTRSRVRCPVAAILALFGLGACTEARALAPRPAARETPSPPLTAPPASAATPDAAAPAELVTLEVAGFLPSLVAVPAGPGPHAVLVATHGAGGAPEAYCERFRQAAPLAFVVCPRGRRLSRFEPESAGFYYPDHIALGNEVAACLQALSERFGARVDARDPVYFGFSQGASMGMLALPRFHFRAAVFAEGGYDGWSVRLARAFRENGGRRVLFACGIPACVRAAKASIAALALADIEARLTTDLANGHAYGEQLDAQVIAALPWLLEGDERFGR